MFNLESFGWVIGAIIVIYIAVCFGKIASKHGKNPILYVILRLLQEPPIFKIPHIRSE